MKKTLSVISVLALGACVYGTPVNNEGLYTDMDLTSVDWSTINRSGRACQTNIFGLIPVGDNSLPAAVKNAKIEKIGYVDTDYVLYFPIMSQDCTNVWGTGYGMPIVSTPATVAPAPKADTKAKSTTKATATNTTAKKK